MPPAPSHPLLRAERIERRDPVAGAVLLHPVTLDLHAGEHLVMSGPSGAGKSVLMRSLALLDPLSGGVMSFQGRPVPACDVPLFRSRVAYLRQRPALLGGTVEDNLRLPFELKINAGRMYLRERALQLLEAAGKPAGFLAKEGRDLSGGEAQVMGLVRALQFDPDVLLLDEPTAALDPDSTAQVESLVLGWARERRAEVATVWISHDPAQGVRVGTRHCRMVAGRLSFTDATDADNAGAPREAA
ncbi:MAG: transporter ATP-binding protein [Betaproteobacteria bacterium]|nr:transporter ATP-binding protein [Betaproteobacteria bacterium]